jgi:hypothetical protein
LFWTATRLNILIGAKNAEPKRPSITRIRARFTKGLSEIMDEAYQQAIDILFDARTRVLEDCGFWGTIFRRYKKPSTMLRNAQKYLVRENGGDDFFVDMP